jgi:hypothetical protein
VLDFSSQQQDEGSPQQPPSPKGIPDGVGDGDDETADPLANLKRLQKEQQVNHVL